MKTDRRQMLGTLAAVALGACSTKPASETTSTTPASTPGQTTTSMKKDSFGKMPNGDAADLYTLTNANGVSVTITTYGGRVVSLKVPDKKGAFADVVLGFD